jgi:phosphatidylinositol 3-kinase
MPLCPSLVLMSCLPQVHGSIKQYLEKVHPHPTHGIKPEVLDTFIKSCGMFGVRGCRHAYALIFCLFPAGYCVFTYILGVGDRHSENLMLTENGHLFHIDFGFILGNGRAAHCCDVLIMCVPDPKPFAPPFKLSPDMVEAMGGYKSVTYEKFKTYCCEAYNILRKSASLIINLFSLMLNANIPQIVGSRSLKIVRIHRLVFTLTSVVD